MWHRAGCVSLLEGISGQVDLMGPGVGASGASDECSGQASVDCRSRSDVLFRSSLKAWLARQALWLGWAS